jgi:hypothetical protein
LADYRKVRVRVEHTQARQVSIGERRRSDPQGQPGYLRVDKVTAKALDVRASQMSDTVAARRMQKAKPALLSRCRGGR